VLTSLSPLTVWAEPQTIGGGAALAADDTARASEATRMTREPARHDLNIEGHP
jgi:hypothetical protein